jgi:hypothetical protein
MTWWLVGELAASVRRQRRKGWSFEQERERELLDAYARGYKKYRQRQKQSKRRER